MITPRAAGKVNLCLYLGPSRPDGRHELVSVIQPLVAGRRASWLGPAGEVDEVVCPGSRARTWPAGRSARYRQATGWAAATGA